MRYTMKMQAYNKKFAGFVPRNEVLLIKLKGEAVMSLFQCDVCGCMDNTALAIGEPLAGSKSYAKIFDWNGMKERIGKELCSACAPSFYSDGAKTKMGKWHNQFNRYFLDKGMFFTNSDGNLEHKETGRTDIEKMAYDVVDVGPRSNIL